MAKISEITLQEIKNYNRVDLDEDDMYIQNIIMPACIAYIKGYTGLSLEQIDSKEDMTIAFMVLCADMYNNRDYHIQNDKVNVVVKSILDMYSVNLL